MAKKKKTSTQPEETVDQSPESQDAENSEEVSQDQAKDQAADDAEAIPDDAADASAAADASKDDVAAAEGVDDTVEAKDAEATETEEENNAEGTEEPIASEPSGKSAFDDIIEPADPVPPEPPQAAPAPEAARSSGFFPMLLGGVVAAAIGFFAAPYVAPGLTGNRTNSDLIVSLESKLQAQSDALSGLSAQIGDLPGAPDLTGIEAAQSDLAAAIEGLSSRFEGTEAQLAALESRLTEIEQRPLTEGGSEAAVAAYDRELRALQAAMAAQRTEIEAMAAEARAMEQNAQATAQATMQRSAMTRIQTALDSGTGFAAALADLEASGVAAPASLTQVADDGVPSLTELKDSFPEAARAALASSRSVTAEDSGSAGFTAFLRSQLGARSLEPREGNDPDAILSRAEAALHDGRLNDSLAEIDSLPELGRAELSDWSGQVARRLEAVAAAEALSATLN